MKKPTDRDRGIYSIQLDKGLSYGQAAVIYDRNIEKQIQKEIKNKRILHCRDVSRRREYDRFIKIIPALCEKQIDREMIILNYKSFLALPIPQQCKKCRRIAIRRSQGYY